MTQDIHIIQKPREALVASLEAFTIEQLNTIPPGYNNNIIWNLGHLVAAQLGICYRRAGLELPADLTEFFEIYKPGSKPERSFTAEDLEQIKTLLFTTLVKLDADRQTNIFDNYATWTTRYGADIHNINDAVAFLPFHEGLHIGVIFGLRKLV